MKRDNVPLNHKVEFFFHILDSYFATMDWLEIKTPWFLAIFANLTFIVILDFLNIS